MKKNISILPVLFLLLSLCACQEKKEIKENIIPAGTIDLNRPGKAEILKFSQLADNIRYIPLETSQDCILSPNLKVWVSDKYIITIDSDGIRQFSPEGKFIRELASSVEGPGGPAEISSYTIDEQKDILYYSQQYDWENIYAISLRDGQPAGKIYAGCQTSAMCIVNGEILCFPSKYYSGKNLDIFRITPSGNITDSIPASRSGKRETAAKRLPGKEEGRYILLNDTVFSFGSGQPRAIAAIRLSNQFTPESENANFYNIILQTPEHFIIRKDSTKVSWPTQGGMQLYKIKIAIILADARTFETTQIDKFYMDILDLEFPWILNLQVSGQKLYHPMPAFVIKKMAKDKKKAGKALSPALQQLDKQLTEKSNPVIIVGDLK